MALDSAFSLPDVRADRTRITRRTRCIAVAAATATIALLGAAPAFASGGDEGEDLTSAVLATVDSATQTPAPPTTDAVSAVAEEAVATVEEAAGIDAAPEITTAVDGDPGNVNVSVRVLSPGVDEAVSQDPGTAVISPDPERDIAAEPETGADAEKSGAQPASPSESVNTNVSIRILSPGSNGEVTQTHETAAPGPTEAAAEAGADPGLLGQGLAQDGLTISPEPDGSSGSTAGDSDLGEALSASHSDGYHSEDSQYQSETMSSSAAWYWSWWFVIDCDGNATTSSAESGSPASLDWTWEWAWEWSCTDGDTGPPASAGGLGSGSPGAAGSSAGAIVAPSTSSASGNTSISVRVLSPGDNGPVDQTTTGSSAPTAAPTGTRAPGEPWDWSWTFTFCDTTTALSNQAASGTPLRWTWVWTWNWSCDAAVGPPPNMFDGAQPEPAVSSPTGVTDVISGAVPVEALADAVPASSPTDDPELTSTRAAGDLRLAGLTEALRTLAKLAGLRGLELPRIEVATAIGVVVGAPPRLPGLLVPQMSLPSPPVPLVDVSVVVVTEDASTAQSNGSARAMPPKNGLDARIPAPAPAQTTRSPSTPRTTAVTTWRAPARENRAASTPTVKRPTVRPAPPDRPRGPLAPFDELGSSRASGAGTFGGLVPSAPPVAVAALTGLFVLVAPGVGRRIRVARELSPRATYRSSIDHPG